jgi:hypothetical protein
MRRIATRRAMHETQALADLRIRMCFAGCSQALNMRFFFGSM